LNESSPKKVTKNVEKSFKSLKINKKNVEKGGVEASSNGENGGMGGVLEGY